MLQLILQSIMIMKKITIYSAPHCPGCVLVKKYLDKNNIVYEELDVYEDDNMNRLQNIIGCLTVPVTDIDGEFVIGYDEGKLKALL